MSLIKLFAIAQFCSDWHSGQSSRGYRILCLALRRLAARGQTLNDAPRWTNNTKWYRTLENNHRHKV